MGVEEQINTDLLAQNARFKERIGVLEARLARSEGRADALSDAVLVLKEIATTIGVKGVDYLDEWTKAAVHRDKLIAAGDGMQDLLLQVQPNEKAREAVATALTVWKQALVNE